MNILNNLSEEDFFQNYWEQKPLVIRNAIAPELLQLDESELMQMAQDDYFESRLVLDREDGKKVISGPIANLDKYKNSKWTLFIHNLNLYNDLAMNIEKAVEFIPKYLFDDVMCSVSTEDATVGAHFDPYNVFILQVSGLREWSLQHEPEGIWDDKHEIKVLKNFSPDQTFILNPGDILYIPAQVAHQGVSLEDSTSLSIGFNSFESKNLVNNYLTSVLAQDFEEQSSLLKNDPFYFKKSDPFLVDREIIEDMKEPLEKMINSESMEHWLMAQMTTPKKEILPPDEIIDFVEFLDNCKAQSLCFDEFCKMVAFQSDDEMIVSFNSELAKLNQIQYQVLKDLYSKKHQTFKYKSSALDEFIYELYSKGAVFFAED